MARFEIASLDFALQIARESLLNNSNSGFASLATLSTLRTGKCATYTHEALAKRLGADLLQRAILKLHSQVFYDWLKTPFDNQWIAVQKHLPETNNAKEVWAAPFTNYIPDSAALPERQLFEADLSIILMLVRAKQDETAETQGSISWRLAVTLRTMKGSIANRKLTLGHVADDLRVSRNYLGHIFRLYTGLTFHQYLLAARMFQAAALLRSNPLPLKQVARLLGYTNEANLCRDFLRAFGTGPTSYRLKALMGG